MHTLTLKFPRHRVYTAMLSVNGVFRLVPLTRTSVSVLFGFHSLRLLLLVVILFGVLPVTPQPVG